MPAWLAAILSGTLKSLLESIVRKIMEWVGFKTKTDSDSSRIDEEVEAVKVATEIIDQKKAQGIEPSEEDYARLKDANRRLSSGTF